MIAIHTKFIEPTNTRGARIKAYTAGAMGFKGFTATVPYSYGDSNVLAHFEAVKALVSKNKLAWDLENMRYGDSADGKGYCFCFNQSKVTTC